MIVENEPRCIQGGPVLVVAAHPDDGLMGAGGLAALAVAGGKLAFILTVTDGELGGDPDVRVSEEAAAARILGLGLEFGHLPDTRVELRAAIEVVGAVISRLQPSTVLVHAPDDSHQDHTCLSQATVSACRFVPNLLFYEGPTSQDFRPSMVLDISRVWEQKRQALLSHRSQLVRANLLEWTDSVSRFRAWPRHPQARCEAFVPHHCDARSIVGLAYSSESRAVTLAGPAGLQ